MTITNESGGRKNVFANEPEIDVIASEANHFSTIELFVL